MCLLLYVYLYEVYVPCLVPSSSSPLEMGHDQDTKYETIFITRKNWRIMCTLMVLYIYSQFEVWSFLFVLL